MQPPRQQTTGDLGSVDHSPLGDSRASFCSSAERTQTLGRGGLKTNTPEKYSGAHPALAVGMTTLHLFGNRVLATRSHNDLFHAGLIVTTLPL